MDAADSGHTGELAPFSEDAEEAKDDHSVEEGMEPAVDQNPNRDKIEWDADAEVGHPISGENIEQDEQDEQHGHGGHIGDTDNASRDNKSDTVVSRTHSLSNDDKTAVDVTFSGSAQRVSEGDNGVDELPDRDSDGKRDDVGGAQLSPGDQPPVSQQRSSAADDAEESVRETGQARDAAEGQIQPVALHSQSESGLETDQPLGDSIGAQKTNAAPPADMAQTADTPNGEMADGAQHAASADSGADAERSAVLADSSDRVVDGQGSRQKHAAVAVAEDDDDHDDNTATDLDNDWAADAAFTASSGKLAVGGEDEGANDGHAAEKTDNQADTADDRAVLAEDDDDKSVDLDNDWETDTAFSAAADESAADGGTHAGGQGVEKADDMIGGVGGAAAGDGTVADPELEGADIVDFASKETERESALQRVAETDTDTNGKSSFADPTTTDSELATTTQSVTTPATTSRGLASTTTTAGLARPAAVARGESSDETANDSPHHKLVRLFMTMTSQQSDRNLARVGIVLRKRAHPLEHSPTRTYFAEVGHASLRRLEI